MKKETLWEKYGYDVKMCGILVAMILLMLAPIIWGTFQVCAIVHFVLKYW